MGKPGKVKSQAQLIRERTLGNGQITRRRYKTVDLPLEDDGEDVTVVVVAPSISQQEAAQQACGMKFLPTADGTRAVATFENPLRYRVEMVIACVRAPEFGPSGEVVGYSEQVYTEMERPGLLDLEDRGWFKRLADEVTNFANRAPEAAAKNSKATSTGAPASA